MNDADQPECVHDFEKLYGIPGVLTERCRKCGYVPPLGLEVSTIGSGGTATCLDCGSHRIAYVIFSVGDTARLTA